MELDSRPITSQDLDLHVENRGKRTTTMARIKTTIVKSPMPTIFLADDSPCMRKDCRAFMDWSTSHSDSDRRGLKR